MLLTFKFYPIMLSLDTIREYLAAGENFQVEFKLDAVENRKLAAEIVGLCNQQGGYIFLGVDDDGNAVGLEREDNEERVQNLCAGLIEPAIIPGYYEREVGATKIGIIDIQMGNNKPYSLKDSSMKSKNFFLRYGSTTRQIQNRDELQRLFQASGNLHYEVLPVSYSSTDDLDEKRAWKFVQENIRFVKKDQPEEEVWRVLKNLELLVESPHGLQPTVAGILLFGKDRLKRLVPQSGIQCVKVNGTKVTDEKFDQALYTRTLWDNLDDAFHFFRRYNRHGFQIEGANRINQIDYPEEAFRELLANAMIHRDYTIAGSEVRIWIYDDRIEIISPGALPNTIGVENIRLGVKYHRNPLLAQFFAQANLVERLGQGIPSANHALLQNGNPELGIEAGQHEVKMVMLGKDHL